MVQDGLISLLEEFELVLLESRLEQWAPVGGGCSFFTCKTFSGVSGPRI